MTALTRSASSPTWQPSRRPALTRSPQSGGVSVFRDLAAVPYERDTLKKSREAFAMVYDHLGTEPNPLRDKRVKLPHKAARDMRVPLASHVEAVARALPPEHLLPYLVIDWTGLRLGAIEGARVEDLDGTAKPFSRVPPLPKTRNRNGWQSMTCSLPRSSHDCRRGRTGPRRSAIPRIQGSQPTDRDNARRAATRAPRVSPRTNCASGAAPSSPSRGTRWRRLPSGSGIPR